MNEDSDQFEVTPWDVKGHVNYERLIDKFGTNKIDSKLLKRIKRNCKELHMYLRRKFFYSHRDLEKVLDDYEDGKGFFLYTGRAPSGKMHIGHIIPFYMTKWFQEKFDVNLYIQIPDGEKFWARGMSLDEIDKYAEDNIKEIAAVGFDPDKTFIFKNREYIGNMYDGVVKIAEKVNFSVVKSVFGFESSTNIGMIFYPALQMIPTFFEKKRCLIPAAIDQDPYWRVQRDLAESFGYFKTAAVHSKFIPALTGPEGKMSSSKPKSVVFLDENEESIREKINQHAFSGGKQTQKKQRKEGADLSVDVSYQWLHNLFMKNDNEIKEIRKKYSNGEMLTGEIKQILIEKLTDFLEKHQKRKENADDLVDKLMYEGDLAQEMWNKKIDLKG